MLKVFSGTSHNILSSKIEKSLKNNAQINFKKLSKINIKKYSDSATLVSTDENVRGSNTFIIQSTSKPINDHLIELCMISDTLKRSYAKSVTAVIPYFGYSRSDRKTRARESLGCKVAAKVLETNGIDNIITLDMHSHQTFGFFDIPITHIMCTELFRSYLKSKDYYNNMVIVSPDLGGVKRAQNLEPHKPLCIINKIRDKNTGDISNVHIIGNVKDKVAVIVDDIIDTGRTLLTSAKTLKENGAKKIIVCATHGVLSDNAVENLKNNIFDEIIITDTIENKNCPFTILSTSKIIANTITNTFLHKQITDFY